MLGYGDGRPGGFVVEAPQQLPGVLRAVDLVTLFEDILHGPHQKRIFSDHIQLIIICTPEDLQHIATHPQRLNHRIRLHLIQHQLRALILPSNTSQQPTTITIPNFLRPDNGQLFDFPQATIKNAIDFYLIAVADGEDGY